MRISCSNAGYTMFRGSVKGTGYPLHSPVTPSLPLPCVTMCHHISTGLYVFLLLRACCLLSRQRLATAGRRLFLPRYVKNPRTSHIILHDSNTCHRASLFLQLCLAKSCNTECVIIDPTLHSMLRLSDFSNGSNILG